MIFAVAGLAVAVTALSVALLLASRRRTPAGAPLSAVTAAQDAVAAHDLPNGQPRATLDSAVWELLVAPDLGEAPAYLFVTGRPADMLVTESRGLSAAAPLARGLQSVLNARLGRLAVSTGADLVFRFEANSELLRGIARGIYEIMPTAAGNGVRSAVREAAGARRIVGHGAFLPSEGAAVAGMGAAAAPALAPVLIVAAITAGLEMAAAAEQQRRLQELQRMLQQLAEDSLRARLAVLEASADTLDLAGRALLDKADIPTSLGVGGAAHAVAGEWARSRRQLREWRQSLESLGEAVSLEELCGHFTGMVDLDGGAFWREVAFFRASLALRARATVLVAAEAATRRQDEPFTWFRPGLERRGREVEAAAEDLRTFARQLASRRIRVGTFVSGGTANHAIELTHRLSELADSIENPAPMLGVPVELTSNGRLAIEGIRRPDGSIQLVH